MLGQSGDDLLKVHVLLVKQYFSDDPAVSVPLPVINDDSLSGHQAGKIFFRSFAVGLPNFRRVDTLQPYFALNVTTIEYNHRIAVVLGRL